MPSIFQRLSSGVFFKEKVFVYGYCDASWGCNEDGSSVRVFVFKVLTGQSAGLRRNNQQLLYLLLNLSTWLCLMLFTKQFD
jgi:hypothetical protein